MYGNNFEIETVGLQVVSFLVVCHEGRKINFPVNSLSHRLCVWKVVISNRRKKPCHTHSGMSKLMWQLNII